MSTSQKSTPSMSQSIPDVFVWDSQFETGIPEIDLQHQKLVQLINSLARLLVTEAEASSLQAIYGALAEYTVYHFSYEENLMERLYQDPQKYEEHKRSHADFVKKVTESMPSANACEITGSTLTFLTKWLLTHILGTDMHMAKKILALQAGAPEDEASRIADSFMHNATEAILQAMDRLYENLSNQTRYLLEAKRRLDQEIEIRKLEEDELRIAATAFESHEGMIITDVHTNIIRVNQAFTTITGYSAEEVIGKTPNILSSGRQGKDFYRAMWERIRNDGSWEGEIWNMRKNGEIYPEHLTITAVNNKAGIVTHYVGALTDITERQKALDKLHNTAIDLEVANLQVETERAKLAERVEERTAQLKNANKAKDTFLATMSHEIRTPLGGLMGTMELLDISNLGIKQRELLKTARDSADSLLRIVNDILDWSKIEAGKLEIVAHPSSICTLLKGVCNTYEPVASVKNISLQCYCDEKLSSAHQFDRLRISQILNNLTSNALKFTDHGIVEVRAELTSRNSEIETIQFSVKDSGIGISTEHQARIFQQYEQASNETARMYGGTGLGLAICHQLAELMGGKLSVESSPGQGSTFIFTLDMPIAKLVDQRELQQPINEQDMRNDNLDLAPLLVQGRLITILIVDDHPVNRMLLKKQLELLGLNMEVAESGVSALSLYQNRHFDLVITDCHMQGMDGYELTRQIRTLEQQAGAERIPIIAWTANVMAEEAERCKTAGMDDILTKPTDLADLRAMLVKWMNRK